MWRRLCRRLAALVVDLGAQEASEWWAFLWRCIAPPSLSSMWSRRGQDVNMATVSCTASFTVMCSTRCLVRASDGLQHAEPLLPCWLGTECECAKGACVDTLVWGGMPFGGMEGRSATWHKAQTREMNWLMKGVSAATPAARKRRRATARRTPLVGWPMDANMPVTQVPVLGENHRGSEEEATYGRRCVSEAAGRAGVGGPSPTFAPSIRPHALGIVSMPCAAGVGVRLCLAGNVRWGRCGIRGNFRSLIQGYISQSRWSQSR